MKEISETRYNSSIVKEWLIEFREREKEIQSQLNRLDVIETRITSIGSPTLTDMPKSPSPFQDRSTYMVGVKIDLEKEINEQQEEQKIVRKEIDTVVRSLKKAEERAVIRARYLDCAFYHENKLSDWNDVTSALFGDRDDFLDKEDSYLRRVHKIHGSALLNMAIYIEDHPVRSMLQMEKGTNYMKINILGTEYTIEERTTLEDPELEKCDGYCDKTITKKFKRLKSSQLRCI